MVGFKEVFEEKRKHKQNIRIKILEQHKVESSIDNYYKYRLQ